MGLFFFCESLFSQDLSKALWRVDPDYEIFFEKKSRLPNRKLKREIEGRIEDFTKLDCDLRRESRERLTSLGRPVIAFLFHELEGGNRSRAINAALILSSLRYAEISPRLESFVRTSGRDDVKAYAILALGKTGREKSASVIQRALASSKNHYVTICSALALGRLRSSESLPLLLASYHRAGNSRVRAALLLALGRLGVKGNPQVKSAIGSGLRGNNALEEGAAILAIGDLAETWGLGEIRKGFNERTLEERLASIAAIIQFAPEEGEEIIRRTAREVRDEEVKSAAVLALGNFKKGEILEQIQGAIADKAQSVRISAAFALTSFGKKEAAPLLKRLAIDPEAEVRRAALLALAFLEDRDSIPFILSRCATLEEKEYAVRSACLLALSLLQGRNILSMEKTLLRGTEEDLKRDWEFLKAILSEDSWKGELQTILLRKIQEMGGLPANLLISTLNRFVVPILGLDKPLEVSTGKISQDGKWGTGLPTTGILTKQEQDVKLWLMDHPYFPRG